MLTAFAIFMDGLVYAAWVFVVALGLTLIFGVMKILNVTHGAFFAFGAYGTATMIGVVLAGDGDLVWAFLLMLLMPVVIGTLLGLLLERGLLNFAYGRDEVVMVLITYASFLIFEDVLLLIWGTDAYFAYQPMVVLGNFSVGRLFISNYDLALVGVAGVTGLATWWGINRTRWGHIVTAVIHDREMASALGVNVARVFTVTFVIGAILGALGGAITAPKISVTPGIGIEVIVVSFAVVAIGGMGAIGGALLGALLVGFARAAAVHLLPEVELFVIYAVMALVLAIRPEGLFTRIAARRI